VATLTLQLPDATLAELLAYARRRKMAPADAGAYVLGFGLVRLALVDVEADPGALEESLDALGEAAASAYAVTASDAMFAATLSPEAKAIGWQGLAVALAAYRGALIPPPTPAEVAALVTLDSLEALRATDAAALAGWLERRTREAEELAAVAKTQAKAAA
jgi:hypothetical protein